jgi:hypothetical protein
MSKATLVELFKPHDYFLVARAIENAVMQSAQAFPMRLSMKADEVKRRAQWCVNVAVSLRRDMHWSGERVADHMTRALHAYLRDGYWDPPQDTKHRIWRS